MAARAVLTQGMHKCGLPPEASVAWIPLMGRACSKTPSFYLELSLRLRLVVKKGKRVEEKSEEPAKVADGFEKQ